MKIEKESKTKETAKKEPEDLTYAKKLAQWKKKHKRI